MKRHLAPLFKRHLALLLIPALAAMFSLGCGALLLGGAAVGGTYLFTEGRLQQDYNANLDRTFQAALGAVEDINLKVLEQEKSVSSASIRAEQQNGTPVWINLQAKAAEVTQVSVRVGYTGDEQASRRVHEAIDKRL